MSHRVETKSGLALDLVGAIACKLACEAHAEFCGRHNLDYWQLSVSGGPSTVDVASVSSTSIRLRAATLRLGAGLTSEAAFKSDIAILLERHFAESRA